MSVLPIFAPGLKYTGPAPLGIYMNRTESRPTIPVPPHVAARVARAEAIFAEADRGPWAEQATAFVRANAQDVWPPFPCDHTNSTCAVCDSSGDEP